jgi:hypothetical protein
MTNIIKVYIYYVDKIDNYKVEYHLANGNKNSVYVSNLGAALTLRKLWMSP